MRPPTRAVMCQWVKKSWDTCLTTEVAKSFISCGINATDGSQDTNTSCFKEEREAEGGNQSLRVSHDSFLKEMTEDAEDPFQEVPTDDPAELEENELVVDDDGDEEDVDV